MKSSDKLGIIEIWRIIACAIIMAYHLPTLDNSLLGTNYRFSSGWIWVEFFFIVTGFFTYNHFVKLKEVTADTAGKNAIEYTVRKFGKLMPYVAIAMLLQCLITGVEPKTITGIVPELLLVSRGKGVLPLLWFLSAMFIVFPLFCCVCQYKNSHLLYVFSLLYSIIIYDTYLLNLGVRTPTHLVRALAGLLLGIVVWYFSSLISQIEYSRVEKTILTVVEQGTMVLAVCLSFINSSQYRFVLICFFIGFGLMVSRISYTKRIKGRAIDCLGQLSMIMFLNQDFVACLINRYFVIGDLRIKIVLHYIIDLFLSILLYVVVNVITKKLNFERLRKVVF